jgi:hypothetical protein
LGALALTLSVKYTKRFKPYTPETQLLQAAREFLWVSHMGQVEDEYRRRLAIAVAHCTSERQDRWRELAWWRRVLLRAGMWRL